MEVDNYYTIFTSKGQVKISFGEENGKFSFEVRGPKEIISKAIGGIGDEDEKTAWATHENLKTEEQRIWAVMEVTKIAQKYPEKESQTILVV